MNHKIVEIKSIPEFQETGLFLLVNQLLFVFGWAIVVKTEENKEVIYPARVKFTNDDPLPKNYKKTLCKHIEKQITNELDFKESKKDKRGSK